MDKYYKFYSLANEKKKQHLVDAITGKNIHMVLYTQVGTNDNKEGHFLLNKPLEEIFRQKLKKVKLTYLIGCASKRLAIHTCGNDLPMIVKVLVWHLLVLIQM